MMPEIAGCSLAWAEMLSKRILPGRVWRNGNVYIDTLNTIHQAILTWPH
jgi:hypothetical protein